MGRFPGWWMRVEPRLASWASLIGLAVVVLGFALDKFASTSKEIAYAVGYMLLCLGAIGLSIFYLVRLGRKARYAEVLPRLRSAIQSILDETRLSGRHKVEERKAAITKVMEEVSAVFTLLAGSSCRACLKLVRHGKLKSLEASTFCRNAKDMEATGTHTIEGNTDFNGLYQDQSLPWFFGNDLPAMSAKGEYHNTNHKWQRSYLASVVWPIREATIDPQGKPALMGFLCVDSKRTNVFSEEFDYPIGALVADALCHFLIDLKESVEPQKDTVQSYKAVVGNKAEPAEGSKTESTGTEGVRE